MPESDSSVNITSVGFMPWTYIIYLPAATSSISIHLHSDAGCLPPHVLMSLKCRDIKPDNILLDEDGKWYLNAFIIPNSTV